MVTWSAFAAAVSLAMIEGCAAPSDKSPGSLASALNICVNDDVAAHGARSIGHLTALAVSPGVASPGAGPTSSPAQNTCGHVCYDGDGNPTTCNTPPMPDAGTAADAGTGPGCESPDVDSGAPALPQLETVATQAGFVARESVSLTVATFGSECSPTPPTRCAPGSQSSGTTRYTWSIATRNTYVAVDDGVSPQLPVYAMKDASGNDLAGKVLLNGRAVPLKLAGDDFIDPSKPAVTVTDMAGNPITTSQGYETDTWMDQYDAASDDATCGQGDC